MRGFKIREKLSSRSELTLFGVLQALSNALVRMGEGSYIQQALVGFGVLHDGGRLSLYRQHYGPLRFLELSDEVTGPAAECRERLDVFGDVKHEFTPMLAPF